MGKEVKIEVCHFCATPQPCLYHPLDECEVVVEKKVSEPKKKKKSK